MQEPACRCVGNRGVHASLPDRRRRRSWSQANAPAVRGRDAVWHPRPERDDAFPVGGRAFPGRTTVPESTFPAGHAPESRDVEDHAFRRFFGDTQDTPYQTLLRAPQVQQRPIARDRALYGRPSKAASHSPFSCASAAPEAHTPASARSSSAASSMWRDYRLRQTGNQIRQFHSGLEPPP
jgi:hypothetical protein